MTKIFSMLINFFLGFVLLTSKAYSSSPISFKDEQEKIMAKFNELNSWVARSEGGLISVSGQRLPVEDMLKLDPIVFFTEMRNVVDEIFIFTFWITFRSRWTFLCNKNFTKKTREGFVAQIRAARVNRTVVSDMLHHFKVYLMQSLATYQVDKAELLFVAKEFYSLRFKKLIHSIFLKDHYFDVLQKQIEEMERHFRFYYLCIEKENLKPLLTKKFRMFKAALESNDQRQVEIHSEHLIFLVGMLRQDRSTVFGFSLVADQSPEFVGYFTFWHSFQVSIDCNYWNLRTHRPQNFSKQLIRYLFENMQNFDYSASSVSLHSKFDHCKKFSNDYKDILSEDELFDLAKTLYEKLLKL
jgi:hypothetical protein